MAKNTRPFYVYSEDRSVCFPDGSNYKLFYGIRKATREMCKLKNGVMERVVYKHGKRRNVCWRKRIND